MRRSLMKLATAAAALCIASGAIASDPERDEIERPVREKYDELIACYDEAVERKPELKGRIVTRYFIETDGEVRSANIIKDQLKDQKMAKCVRKVFLSLQYPNDQDDRVKVDYPLDFK